MSKEGTLKAQRRRGYRLRDAKAEAVPSVVTAADIKADEALMSESLSRLSLAHLAPLRTIALSEARRYASLSLAADDVMSEALRRMWRSAPEMLAALTTEAAGAAHAHFRVTCQSVVSNERERLSVSVSASEAERESAIAAALAADGSFLRADRDEARECSLRLASALALTGHGGSEAEARKAETDANRRERKRFRAVRENELDYAFRVIRETSLERLMTQELRFSSPLSLTTESAGRVGSTGLTLAALTETTERERFREALRLSAASLETRARSCPKAERPVWEALASVLKLSEGERTERFYRQRERTRKAEDTAEAAAAPLAALKAEGKAADRKAVKAAERAATAAERAAQRERDALTLALRLALAGERLSSLLIILDAALDATADMSQSLDAQRKEHGTFDWRSLAEYASGKAADDASLKRWRLALRALLTEAETLAGYEGVTKETLERWRSESVRRELDRLIRRGAEARALADAERERSEAEALRLASLPRYFKYEADRIVPFSEAEAAERDALRNEAERERRYALTAQSERKAAAHGALIREVRERLNGASEARRERFLSALRAGAGAPASLSAEGWAALSTEEREAEAARWRTLGEAPALRLSRSAESARLIAEALTARNFLTAERYAKLLRSSERRILLADAAERVTLAPFTLAAPVIAAGPLPLKAAAPLTTESEREALAEIQALILAEDEAERVKARSVIWRSRQREARQRYRRDESGSRRQRREAAARSALRKAEREAAALALAETLSEASGTAFRVLSSADMAAAAERAAERAEARRDAFRAGERPAPVLTLKRVLAEQSEAEAEETEARREALRIRQSEAEAVRRSPEAEAQRLIMAADAEALRLALAEDERKRQSRRFSPSLPLARRSEDEAAADTLALKAWRRLAGAEAAAGPEALRWRRMTEADRQR